MQIAQIRRPSGWILCVGLWIGWSVGAANVFAEPTAPMCRLPLLQDAEAWERLPETTNPAGAPLPAWARALAGPLPRTTGALLELDYLYRTSDAYDPRLRAAMRWVAAEANQSEYGQQYAKADLQRAGVSAEELENPEATFASWPDKEQAALRLARKLTLAANTVTDAEMAELISSYGEEQVVAMVLQMAYANYFDRLVLALGVRVEPQGPFAPLDVRFAPPGEGESIAAERPELQESSPPAAEPLIEPGADWSAVGFEALLRGMEAQRERRGRIAVPAWEDVHARLPPGMYPRERPVRIQWSLVVMGYQPEMGPAWLKCLRTFAREAQQDRVFQETLFWVITRTIDCFY